MRHAVVPAIVLLVLCGVGRAFGQVRDQKLAWAHYQTGLQLLSAEAWEAAEREFLEAIELDPSLALAHYGLGKAYMGMKNYRRAVGALTTCRDLYRAHAGNQLVSQLERNQRRQEQIFELRQSIREQQSGRQTQQTRRAITLLQEQIVELERQLRRGGSIEADLEVPAFVSLALGSAHFRAGSMADAEREYVAAIGANPAMGEAHNNLAVVYMLTKRLEGAEREIKLAEKTGFRVHPQLKEDLKAAKERR